VPIEPMFAALLRQHRLARGLTQEALAERAGLSVHGVQKLERGATHPYRDTARRLAGALDLAPDDRARFLEAVRPLRRRGAARPRPAAAGGLGNLPAPATSLIGRQAELATVSALLARARLVTLTGAGGVGKTRLALGVAAAVLLAYPDGVWLVPLAALTDPQLVPHAVAAALGVLERGRRPLPVTLSEALRARRALVVLDNCEHLVQACAELAEALLSACPELRILATSREPLGVAGEVTRRVPSLTVPPPPPPPPEQLSQYEAVRLFVERAVAARADFRVTNANAPAVAQVCWRLDGIPLAIELAAAWVRTLSVEQLAARLDDCFGLLVGGSRTAPPRQQTLRGAIEWSYGLLSEPERRLFARLSVFAGGWTLEAAEAVCADDVVAAHEILGLLRQLVDKSLVVAEETPNGTRYRLLEILRAYGRERTQAAGELSALEQRHRRWYLELAEASPSEELAFERVARLAEEQDNLRAALRGYIAGGDAAAGLRLGVSLWGLWYVRGLYAEGRAWLDELLALPGAAPATAIRTRALAWAGHLAECQGDFQAARSRLEAALATARVLADDQEVAIALVMLANVARAQGDTGRARRQYTEALALNRRLGHPFWIALTLNNHARAAEDERDFQAAAAYLTEALELWRARGHAWGTARSLGNLARVALNQGDPVAAEAHLAEALQLERQVGDRQGVVTSLLILTEVKSETGDTAAAGALLAEALSIAREADDRLALTRCLEQVAALLVPDQPQLAVRLAGAAAAAREALGADLTPAERGYVGRWQAAARRALGEAASAAAWAAGRRQSLDQAAAEALALAETVGASAPGPMAAATVDALTPGEREVVLPARGPAKRQIAETQVLGKLGLRSPVQLAAWARAHGLLTGPDA
jgi:predicted ATPase/transcriptional regulator with XRE-family HTH domain/Tfp pilus assembly protein PilF